MNKPMMLLALAAVSIAMLAAPAFASAQAAHLSVNPGTFTVHGGASVLSRVPGGGTHSTTTTGSGTFITTTTGTIKLTFHGVTSPALGNCSSTAEGHPHTAGPGTVTTTTLEFHLITLPTEIPAMLITTNKGHFATKTCGPFNIPVVVSGNGIIGTITSPKCGVASNTAIVKFTASEGVQAQTNYTGTKYTLESSVAGGEKAQSGINAEAKITFSGGQAPSLICTHTNT